MNIKCLLRIHQYQPILEFNKVHPSYIKSILFISDDFPICKNCGHLFDKRYGIDRIKL